LSGVVLFLSRRAADRLAPQLLKNGEYLPVESADGEFVVYHCMNELEHALDVEKSEFRRAPDGRHLSLKRPVFRADEIRGHAAFRISGRDCLTIYVSGEFVESVDSSGLRGFHLEKVWADDDLTGVQCRRASGASDLSLTASKALRVALRQGEDVLGITVATTSMLEVQTRIQKKVDEVRSRAPGSAAEGTHLAATLGTCWGESICRELEWRWAMVHEDGSETVGIVSPHSRYVIYPQGHFYLQLAHGAGPSGLALYKKIESRELPIAAQGDFLVLA
jgi:hypothetical protein